jgi:catechol 2,3-dioxygenase-like lactoylglutathione lyase family enzyme
VDDLDALIGRLEASGGRVARGVDLPGKLRIFFAKDADGNMLELIGAEASRDREPRDRMQIGLTVGDAERSRHFYGHVLGLPEDPSVPMPDRMTRYAFGVGSSTLKFWSRSESLPNLAGAIHERVGIRLITIWVCGLDELEKEIEARGADLVRSATPRPGARHFFVRDPDGNWIEFAEETR